MEAVTTNQPPGTSHLSALRYTPFYFRNSKGRCFAAKIVESQSVRPKCIVCLEDRLSAVSICRHDAGHVVCEVCEPRIINSEYNPRKACHECGDDNSLLSRPEIEHHRKQNQLSLGRTESECLTCHKIMQYSETPGHTGCQPQSVAEGQKNIPVTATYAFGLPLGKVSPACQRDLDLDRDGFDLKRILLTLSKEELLGLRDKLGVGDIRTETPHMIAKYMITGSGRCLPVGYPYSWHSLACIFEGEGYHGLAEKIRTEHPVGGGAQRDKSLAGTDQPIDFAEMGTYLLGLPQEELQELGRALGLQYVFNEDITWHKLVRMWLDPSRVRPKGNPSWNRFANALQNIGRVGLMEKVIRIHPLDPADRPDPRPADAEAIEDTPFIKRMDIEKTASIAKVCEDDFFLCKRALKEMLPEELKSLAVCLGVPENCYSHGKCLDIIWGWIQEEGDVEKVGGCSWNTLANALIAIGKNRIAKEIIQGHPYKPDEVIECTAARLWDNLDKPLTLSDAAGLIRILRQIVDSRFIDLGDRILQQKGVCTYKQKEEWYDMQKKKYCSASFVCLMILKSRNLTIREIARHCRDIGLNRIARNLESGGTAPPPVKCPENNREVRWVITPRDKDTLSLLLRELSNEDCLPLVLELWPGDSWRWSFAELTDLTADKVVNMLSSSGFLQSVTWLQLSQALHNIGQSGLSKNAIGQD